MGRERTTWKSHNKIDVENVTVESLQGRLTAIEINPEEFSIINNGNQAPRTHGCNWKIIWSNVGLNKGASHENWSDPPDTRMPLKTWKTIKCGDNVSQWHYLGEKWREGVGYAIISVQWVF